MIHQPLPHSLLAAIASLYDVAPKALTPLPGGHFNRVFAFQKDGRACVLRLTPPDPETNLDAARSILAFLKFLAGGGVQVPEPVESRGGLLIETLPDPEHPNGPPYLASAFLRAPGFLAEEMPVMVWEDALLEAIGCAVGSFHARSSQYRPLPAHQRPPWDRISGCTNPYSHLAAAASAASPHHWVLAKRAAVLAEIERLPRTSDSYGLIHNDLHFGNFYFERQPVPGHPWSVTILDFDDCACGWYAMDIVMNLLDAAVLRASADWNAFAAAFLPPYLRGYRSAYPFDEAWLQRLPLFLKLLEIGLYLMVADDYNPQQPDEWIGKFMAGRRDRIVNDQPVFDFGNFNI